MNEVLESDAREAEELAAAVAFDISEMDEEELAALPNFGDESQVAAETPAARNAGASGESRPEGVTAAVSDSSNSSAKSHGPAWLDRVLTQLDKPLAFLPPSARRWIGLIAAVTIATALLFSILRPLLFNRRDLVKELRTSVTRIEQERQSSPHE